MKRLQMLLMAVGLTGMFIIAFVFISLPGPAHALPPRPEPVQPVPVKTKPKGAQIQLVVEGALGQMWTQVQWQDPYAGVWYDVVGWRGEMDDGFTKTWWVGEKDMGTGPFRWLLFDEIDGQKLAISDSFDLPDRTGSLLQVPVTLE